MENHVKRDWKQDLEELDSVPRIPRFTINIARYCVEAEELDISVIHTDCEIFRLNWINWVEEQFKKDEFTLAWCVLGVDREAPAYLDHCYAVNTEILKEISPTMFGLSYEKINQFQTYLFGH
ncbi:MAG: hypothetical protein AAF998_10485 [Bacteroidota bacterium]